MSDPADDFPNDPANDPGSEPLPEPPPDFMDGAGAPPLPPPPPPAAADPLPPKATPIDPGLNLQKAPKRKSQAPQAVGRIDRLPPHSIEAEQGVLACVLLAPDAGASERLLVRRGMARVQRESTHRFGTA